MGEGSDLLLYRGELGWRGMAMAPCACVRPCSMTAERRGCWAREKENGPVGLLRSGQEGDLGRKERWAAALPILF